MAWGINLSTISLARLLNDSQIRFGGSNHETNLITIFSTHVEMNRFSFSSVGIRKDFLYARGDEPFPLAPVVKFRFSLRINFGDLL